MKNFLTSFWWLILNVGYLILILLLSFIVLTVPAQSDDFVYVFVQDFELDYIVAVYIAIGIWCFITWYSGCIILQIDPIKGSLNRKEQPYHVDLTINIPKILGIVPCVIFGYSIAVTQNLPSANYKVAHLLGLTGLAILMWVLFKIIDKTSSVVVNLNLAGPGRNTQNPYDVPKGIWPFIKHLKHVTVLGNWPSLNEVTHFKKLTNQAPTYKQELVFIAQFTGVRFFYLWLGGFCLVLTLVMCAPPINLELASWLRPGAIVILTLAGFTLIFTIVAYFHDYQRRPFAIILTIAVIIFSYWNDNTKLEYIESAKPGKRVSINSAFNQWLKVKKESWRLDKDMPVVFIATQGGGIRGLTWTTRILHHLDSTYKGFLDQTFIISGVSGGGVGATTYLTWLKDNDSNDFSYDKFNSFTKRDFLSPVTASFAFSDFFQRFLPFPVSSFNRSRMLGRTWDEYYQECVGKNSLAEPFLDLWYTEQGFDFKIPSLILNGTLAENGQRVVTSNLSFDSTIWFDDDIDFFKYAEGDISRSTAALNCSRFPVLTSGALIARNDSTKGHIVDGGYRENTGVQTLLNIFWSIRKRLNDEKGIKVLFIYLQNGQDERDDQAEAATVLQDILVPIQGLVQVNGTGLPAKSIIQFAKQTFDKSIAARDEFMVFSLNSNDTSKIKFPLGWYMSEIVSKEIDRRIERIPIIDSARVKILKEWFN